MMITENTLLQRKPDIIFSKMDNEVVMLNMEKGEYYGLDEIASRIWEIIEHEITFSSLVDSLLEEFDVERKLCEKDTIEFLEDLIKRNLLVIK